MNGNKKSSSHDPLAIRRECNRCFRRHKNVRHAPWFSGTWLQLWQLNVSYAPMDWQFPTSHYRLFLRFGFILLSHSTIFGTVIYLMAVLVLIATVLARNHVRILLYVCLAFNQVLMNFIASVLHAEILAGSLTITRTNERIQIGYLFIENRKTCPGPCPHLKIIK